MRIRISLLALVMLFVVAWASATPIKPDLKKLLSAPQRTQQYPPARAGWNGPEGGTSQRADMSPALERYGPQASARAIRSTIWNLFIPDWKALAGLLTVIVLLRFLRSRDQARHDPVLVPATLATGEPEQRAA